jgi:hypothetical protein
MASESNSEQGKQQGLSSKLKGLLAHPMTLLVVGALLSSLLIPSWTKQWQDRQSELQVKVDLVDRIDNSVTEMMMSIQFAILGAESQSQAEYDDAYRRWEIDRRLIQSQLEAYYPEGRLAEDWYALSEQITDFYVRSSRGNPEREEYLAGWEESRESIFERTDELNGEVLRTPISVFH